MINNYKYGITPQELKEARKFIIRDIKSNNKVDNPIYNMTLQDYFDMIKECMLSLIDADGIVKDQFDEAWYSERRKNDIRKLSSKEVAELWMDGRGLFTEHCNGNNKDINYGYWPDIGDRDHNRWYHKDRLDDPLWFKQCTQGSIGAGGHPCENLMISNIYPVMYEEDKWYIVFGSRANDYGVLKAYLHCKKDMNIPCFIYGADRYLTEKQKNQLKKENLLLTKNYSTGYGLNHE